ncbi:MAG: histidinol-phosphatase [Acutalibacteraceae bacterium]
MIKSNCHTHTILCDGKNTAEEMVIAAIEKGFESLCFTGHSPMKNESDWTMTETSLPLYKAQTEALKERFADKIDILCGIELDSDFKNVNLKDFYPVIGSVHQFENNGKFYDIDYTFERLKSAVDEVFDGSFIKMAETYYNKLTDFIIQTEVDIVGHIDLICKFNEQNPVFSESDEAYKSIVFSAVDKILNSKPDIIFEVNTGAMYRLGNKKPYPDEFVLKYIISRGGRLTVSSDAHCTEALDFAFSEAVNLCKNCGAAKLYYFTADGVKSFDI